MGTEMVYRKGLKVPACGKMSLRPLVYSMRTADSDLMEKVGERESTTKEMKKGAALGA